MRKHLRKAAFTLVELLVVIGIIALLIGLLLPALSRAQESSKRIKCAANLRQFGQAMISYASSNKGNFPRAYYDKGTIGNTATGSLVLNTNGAKATNPFSTTGMGTVPGAGSATTTGSNNVPAAIFLLVRGTYLTPEVLVCPSMSNIAEPDLFGDPGDNTIVVTDRVANRRSNFTNLGFISGPTNLSYSMNVPYPTIEAMQKGWLWDTAIDPDTVLAADLNPGQTDAKINTVTYNADITAIQLWNSRNHRGLRGGKEGQNVCYADGHVEFKDTPYCGPYRVDLSNAKFRDNIYTANPPGATDESNQTEDNTSRPGTKEDCVCLPAADSQ
jgi:prepilin-type N-terminal cleavage/methylation domain-containing protein/prepilin-type processing-associated H-X9-DG protein